MTYPRIDVDIDNPHESVRAPNEEVSTRQEVLANGDDVFLERAAFLIDVAGV